MIRYSDGVPLKRPFYNAEVRERAAGERARWLAAVLMVASIAATSVIVRFWHADTPAPLPVLASRHIHLYLAPVAPPSGPSGRPAFGRAPFIPRVQADPLRPASAFAAAQLGRDRKAGRHLHVPEVTASVDAVQLDGKIDPVAGSPQEIAVAVVASETPVPNVPVAEREPPAAVAVVASVEVPLIEAAAAPLPDTSSSSRGIVEMPAVAVTRAVTIAGRGIMIGLRATGAILRAPF